MSRRKRRAEADYLADYVLVRPPDLLVVELKSQRARISEAQRAWLDDLEAAGVEVHVWRPPDVDAVLVRLARRWR